MIYVRVVLVIQLVHCKWYDVCPLLWVFQLLHERRPLMYVSFALHVLCTAVVVVLTGPVQ